MLCSNCGQPIGEGAVFCKHCGASAPAAVEPADGREPDRKTTEVRSPTGGLTEPPVPASSESARPPVAPSVSPSPPHGPNAPSPSSPGAAHGQAWRPPKEPPRRRHHNTLIIGIVAAAVVILAGAGVGTYLAVRGDDSDTTSPNGAGSTSTTVASSTAEGRSTASVTTGSTVRRVPSPTTIPATPGRPGAAVGADASLEDYLLASDNLAQELQYDDVRIPEIATQINDAAPNVPQWVWDELQSMMGQLDAALTNLLEVPVATGFEESDEWLIEAASAMGDRIYATVQGIEAMWNTNSVGAATGYFDQGRASRDRYRAAMQQFQNSLPVD